MPEAGLEIVRITIGDDCRAEEVDELARLLDEAGLDAVVEPAPRRMGVPGVDLVVLAVEIPLQLLGTLLLTTIGQRIWQAIGAFVRRRRAGRAAAEPVTAGSPAAGPDVVVTVHDPRRRIRLDLTLQDLADDQLLAELARLGEVATTPGPLTMVWDATTAGWRTKPADE